MITILAGISGVPIQVLLKKAMIYLITFSIIVLIFIYGLIISISTRDYLNPIMSFIAPIFIGYFFFIAYYRYECSEYTILTYLMGITGFSLGFIFHRLISRYKLRYICFCNEYVWVIVGFVLNSMFIIDKGKQPKIDIEKHKGIIFISPNIIRIFKVLTVLSIILTLKYVSSIANNGPFGSNMIRNIRYMSNYVTEKGFFTEYSMVIAKVYMNILLYQYFVQGYSWNKRWIIITTMAAMIGIASTIARTQILDMAISWYYLYSLKRIVKMDYSNGLTWKKIKEKLYIVLALIAVVYVFYFFAAVTMKLGSGGLTSTDYFINRYMGQELVHFEQNVRGYARSGKGYYTLGWITKTLSALRIINSPEVLESIIQRTHGAVCSFIRTPYIDFGAMGVFVVMFVIGFSNSFVYKRVLYKMGYWSIFYTTCIYSNLMAFFDYQYMMSGQMYFIFVLILAGWGRLEYGKNS